MLPISKLALPFVLPLLLAHSLPAQAESTRFEEPIRYRKAVMTMIKRHYDQLSAMAKGTIPATPETLNRHADALDMLAKLMLDGFVPGSHEGDTRARPEIWKQWKEFRAQAEAFQADAGRLQEIARSGRTERLKAAVNDMTRTCKNCHDDFKSAS